MELQTTCGRMGTMKAVFDDMDERPVDCDFLLPDYLPEITAILKCRMKPTVQSHQISGDRVLADGVVTLHLLYLDEERRCVHSYDCSQPFSSSFTVKNLKSSDSVRLTARTSYVNCRAIGPRRVDVHGAFRVHLTVLSETGTELITDAHAEGLHTRGCTIAGTVVAGSAEKTVTLNEVLELTAVATSLVRCDAVAVTTECRQLPGKAVVKGDVLLETVYTTDGTTGAAMHDKHRLPFSQIVDLDGLAEEQLCHCRAEVVQCEVRLTSDPAGENRLLSAAVRVTVTLMSYRTEEQSMLTDAYHTVFPIKTETCRVQAKQLLSVHTDTVTAEITQDLPQTDIAEIVDMWCEVLSTDCRENAGQMQAQGQLLIAMLARDGEGCVAHYERPADYAIDLPWTTGCVETELTPTDMTYTQNANSLTVRIAMQMIGTVTHTEDCAAITRMSTEESAPYREEGVLAGCCLKVCYAAAGESVWELARREHTSPEAIRVENGLSGEVLEQDTLLFIPLR